MKGFILAVVAGAIAFILMLQIVPESMVFSTAGARQIEGGEIDLAAGTSHFAAASRLVIAEARRRHRANRPSGTFRPSWAGRRPS